LGLDLFVMHWLGDIHGFALRDHWWLSVVLHDKARQISTIVYMYLWLMVVWPVGRWRILSNWQRWEVTVGTTVCLLAVNTIKRHSLSSCPWDLSMFGGVAQYVSHWHWGVTDGGPGVCFPGGHASAAFAFWPIALVWRSHKSRRPGPWALAIGVLGLLFGTVQSLRGAHYPSHTLWTALICATVALFNHRLFLQWRRSVAGTHASANLHSLLETRKVNSVDG
jgi:membrane-associated PAP2 superfamily phosphatase